MGSFQELKARATSPLPEPFDPHRPYVDQVELTCACGGTMRRVLRDRRLVRLGGHALCLPALPL